MVDTNSRRRVKLYMLNADRAWDDRGTGHISSMFAEKYRGMCLQVRSEEDGGYFLRVFMCTMVGLLSFWAPAFRMGKSKPNQDLSVKSNPESNMVVQVMILYHQFHYCCLYKHDRLLSKEVY